MSISLDFAPVEGRFSEAAPLLYDSSPVESSAQSSGVRGVPKDRDAPDARLVSLARTGDLAAFEELVRRYRNDVFRLCYHFTRNREEAWDLSQQAFVKSYSGLGRFRGEANYKTWVLRIAANQCKDFLKKRRLPTVGFDETLRSDYASSSVRAPNQVAEADEIGRAIESALQDLPVKHRTAFILREYEGMTYNEMAHVMRCNLGTVMSRLHHARRKLQYRLYEMGVAPGGWKREETRNV
jgi:RNA polymerase sigma-70 factor (ECF subfamily)